MVVVVGGSIRHHLVKKVDRDRDVGKQTNKQTNKQSDAASVALAWRRQQQHQQHGPGSSCRQLQMMVISSVLVVPCSLHVQPVRHGPARQPRLSRRCAVIGSLPEKVSPGRQFIGKRPSRPGGRRTGRIFADKLSVGETFLGEGRFYNGTPAGSLSLSLWHWTDQSITPRSLLRWSLSWRVGLCACRRRPSACAFHSKTSPHRPLAACLRWSRVFRIACCHLPCHERPRDGSLFTLRGYCAAALIGRITSLVRPSVWPPSVPHEFLTPNQPRKHIKT